MRIVNYLADEFKKTSGVDLRQDKQVALPRLKEVAEQAKKELSSRTDSTCRCRSSAPTPLGRSTST